MAIKHLILDVSGLVALWMGRPGGRQIQTLVDQAPAHGVRLWMAAASLPKLEYVTRLELEGLGMSRDEAKQRVTSLMEELFSRAGVLSIYGFEQQGIYLAARDFENAQIAAAARCLRGGDVRLVTLDPDFDSLGEVVVVDPLAALEWLRTPRQTPSHGMPFVDLAAQQSCLRVAIESRIERVLRHGKYILGPEVSELEEKLGDYVGVKHCITLSSGTDALLTALMALGVGPGDDVITTPFSFIATAEAIALLGARPVFVDIDERTYNLDPRLIEVAITTKTRAIMPVSLYGQCADFDAINAIAQNHGLPVIEDGAQSFGATYKGRKSCALSTIGATSFFPSKPLGCYGDGGAVFTNDDNIGRAMREIRVHGQDRHYHHSRLGINGRLDTLQAAVLLAKLEHFDWEVRRRTEAAEYYTQRIALLESPVKKGGSNSAGIVAPYVEPHNTAVYAQYTVRVGDRSSAQRVLGEAAIPTAVHYPVPLHLQPVFAHLGYHSGDFPVAEGVSAQVVSLPMHPYLTEQQQDAIVAALVRTRS